MRGGEGEQFIKRGQGSRGDEGGGRDAGGLDAGIVNFCRCCGLAGGFHEEGGFAAVRFNQIEGDAGGDAEHEAGKART